MAAASDPDEVFRSTTGKANFHRATRLLISGGATLLREFFDLIHPPSCLPKTLTDPVKANQLKSARLSKPQWDCLYPSPGVWGKSPDFDVTLLFKLLRTICNLTPPVLGWDVLPTSTDHSLVADLARIKYYRNSVYAHVNQNMEITDDEFPQLWQEISEALVRIAGQISPAKKKEWQEAIDNFLRDPLTAEDERNVQELIIWYNNDTEVKKSMEELKTTTQEGMERLVTSLKDVQEGLEKELKTTTQGVQEGMEHLETSLKGVQEGLEEKAGVITASVKCLETVFRDEARDIKEKIGEELKTSAEEGMERLETSLKDVQEGLSGAKDVIETAVREEVQDIKHELGTLHQSIDRLSSSAGGSQANGARLGLRITCEAISEPGVRVGGSEVVAASQEPQGLQGRFLASQEPQAGEVQSATVVPITSTLFQHQPSAPGGFGGDNIGINEANIPSAEGVLNFIALKYFQTVDPSKPEERNDFLKYLKEVRQVLYVDTQTGSLIITVESSSLEILEGLWNDYCTGHLNEMAHKFLVTEDILKEFGLIEVKLTTTILEEEYKACRGYFLQHSGLDVLPYPVSTPVEIARFPINEIGLHSPRTPTRESVRRSKEQQEGRRIHTLNELAMCDFTADIEYHASRDRFHIGTREWVFKDVQDWLDDRSQSQHQAMIITGDAGMGKSVISAVICKRMRDLEVGRLSGSHFCQNNVARYCNPKLMLQSLAFQLSCSLPEYKEALVNQLSRDLGEELNNMGVDDLFALLFKEPLSSVSDPGRNILIVIDGLDECEYQGENQLLDVIANHFCRLPRWIRFLVTTRPEGNILESLKSLKPLELKHDDERNRRDIELFFQKRLPKERTAISRELVELSEGLMLYAYFLIDSIEECAPPTAEQLRSSFPRGISEIYKSYFKRMEAKLQKELEDDCGKFLYHFLCALTAARDPLPEDFVMKILQLHSNSSANDRFDGQRKFNKVVSCISSLLPIRDGHVHIFHKSVSDWLTDTSRYGHHDFTVIAKEGHKILSELCTVELDKLKENCVHDSPFSDLQIYALQHGFLHMLEALEDSNHLENLVKGYATDLELVYAKLCAKNIDVAKDLLAVLQHRNSSALSKEIRSTLQTLLLQFKKHGSLLRDHPNVIFQNLLNEGGSDLSHEVSNFLSRRHHKIPYMELLDKNDHQGPVEARFYCSDKVVCFDVSPDEEHMVCECRDGTIHLWSLRTGELEWQKNCLESKKSFGNVPIGTAFRRIGNETGDQQALSIYRSLVFHPNGQFILPGNVANVYNLDGHLTSLFPSSKCHFTICAFSGDKNRMLTDCPEDTKEVVIWETDNGEEYRRLRREEAITSFALSQDGNFVAISDSKGSFWMYNLELDTLIWQEVAQDNPGEGTVCGLLHFTVMGALVCGSIVSTHSDHRDVYKLSTDFSALVANRPSSPSGPSKLFLWPWESVDSVDRLQDVCNVCHLISADLQMGFCFLLPGESAVVGGPTINYLTMLKVARSNKGGKIPRTVETAFSLDTKNVYTTVTICSPNDPSDKPCLVTLAVQDSDSDSVRDAKAEKSFHLSARRVRNGLLSSPVRRGVLLQTESKTLELWNSDLSECVQSLPMTSEIEKLIPVSEELVACVLNTSSLEGQHSLTISMLNVSSWKVVFERGLNGRAELKSVACSIHKDVVFCSEQGASTKRQMILYKGDSEMPTWKKDAIYQGGCSWRHPHCVFSPNGKVMVTWNTLNDGYGLHVLKARTGKTDHIFLDSHYDIADCKFLNDGESVVCYRYDCNLRLFNVTSGVVLAVMDIGERPTCIASSPNKPLIAVGLRFSNVKLIRAQLPRQQQLTSDGHENQGTK